MKTSANNRNRIACLSGGWLGMLLMLLTRPAPAETPQQKQCALDWLGRPEMVEKFGRISDAIWSYAELGLQEHKSSALLVKTLEEAGFEVKKGLAGMPTCFVASWGSGRPVIGILAEYDALPMLSQKGRVPKQEAVVPGAPGHGCGHNLMGAAATAAAIAVKRSMEEHNLAGTIKLFGSPCRCEVAPVRVLASLSLAPLAPGQLALVSVRPSLNYRTFK